VSEREKKGKGGMSRVYLLLALVACTALAVTNTTMPSYYAVGEDPFKLGVSIGEQQKDNFQKLVVADPSLKTVLRPWKDHHPQDYKAFCDANKAAYPDIYEEIRGIAHGAELEEDDTILLMLRPEIESLVADENKTEFANDNCFDIINNPADGKGYAFIAHNEDWTPAYKPFGFVLHENMPFSKGAKHITAFTYPASPVGFTFGYNDFGVVTSCNGLNPKPCRAGKLGRYFINRDVLAATSVDDAIDRLKKAAPNSALGFGMSIGCVGNHTLFHAEMAPYDPHNPSSNNGIVDIIPIEVGKSYLHSNSYTHDFFKDIKQYTSNSTVHRLKRAHEMPEPTTPEKALAILGDETDKRYPIYRYGNPDDPEELATISTALLNLDTAEVTIFGGNPTRHPPVVVMPLFKPEKEEEDSSSRYRDLEYLVALLFWICVGVGFLAAVFFVFCLVFCCCCCCQRRNGGGSVNADYHRVA